jgi:hypothetical protein
LEEVMLELPTLARVKLDGLLAREQDARDAVGAVARRASELSRALTTAPRSEAANVEHELSRLGARQSDLAARYKQLADLNAIIRDWLARSTGTLEYRKSTKATLQKGETISAAVSRLRERIRALADERVKVMRAGVPTADLKKQAAEYVAELARRGKPKITFGHAQPLRAIFNATVDNAFTTQWDIGAALAWLDAPAFLQRLVEEIEALPKPELALSAKARAEKLTALEAELLQCEREEEALIEASEEGEGPAISRRLDADPRAVLCVSLGSDPKPAQSTKKAERVRADAPDGDPSRV